LTKTVKESIIRIINNGELTMNKELLKKYEDEDDYNVQQDIIKEMAKEAEVSIPSIRARLVRANKYKNKPKTTKVYKADLVDQLVEKLELDLLDSEYEYLNRLTVSLIRKILNKV
jgi:hypothetical protein